MGNEVCERLFLNQLIYIILQYQMGNIGNEKTAFFEKMEKL
jgi:hypothetical protein